MSLTEKFEEIKMRENMARITAKKFGDLALALSITSIILVPISKIEFVCGVSAVAGYSLSRAKKYKKDSERIRFDYPSLFREKNQDYK